MLIMILKRCPAVLQHILESLEVARSYQLEDQRPYRQNSIDLQSRDTRHAICEKFLSC